MAARFLALFLSLFLQVSPLAAASFLVTSTSDAGAGTLRQGILDANSGACAAPCTIHFGLQAEGNEHRRILLSSPLPPVVAGDVRILADATRGDLYSGKRLVEVVGSAAGPGDGLRIEGAHGVHLAGLSFVGFSGDGLVADRAERLNVEVCGFERNGRNGVYLVDTFGAQVRGSLIILNGHSGVFAVRSSSASIYSNAIGTDTWNIDRGAALGNALNGIHLHDTYGSYVSMNFIHNNRGYAIFVSGDSALNDLEFNDFTHHRGRPIEIGGDGTGDPLSPVIESANLNRGFLRIRGMVKTEPGTVVRLQFYSAGRLVYFHLQSTGDETGIARFEVHAGMVNLQQAGISAIATHRFEDTDVGQTSEFSATVMPIPDDVTVRVSSAADAGPGTLRDAIEVTNRDEQCVMSYPCAIEFDVPGPIQPVSALPALARTSVWIDGRARAGNVEIDGSLCPECNGIEIRTAGREVTLIVVRNLTIRNFARNGIFVDAGDRNLYALVGECRIVSNGGSGVHVASGALSLGSFVDNRITTRPAEGCVIGDNGGHGLSIGPRGFVRATGNRIGADFTRVVPLANRGSGIFSEGQGEYSGNTIAFNHQHGIEIARPEAVNAVFGGEIHSNSGRGIVLADERPVQRPPAILNARVDGEQTVVTYRVDVESVESPFSYIVAIYASSFADQSRQGEGRMAVTSDYVSRSGTYEIAIPQNLAGKYITATITQFDAFYFRATRTTSGFSEAIQVTSGSCPAFPPSNVVVTGSAFRWTPVPGATEYRIWLMKRGDEPRIAYLGTAPEAELQPAPGEYDWVIEARFGDRCFGTQSDHGVLRVD